MPAILFATGSDDESTPPKLVACTQSAPQLEKPLEKTPEAQPQSAPEAQPERAPRKPAPVQAAARTPVLSKVALKPLLNITIAGALPLEENSDCACLQVKSSLPALPLDHILNMANLFLQQYQGLQNPSLAQPSSLEHMVIENSDHLQTLHLNQPNHLTNLWAVNCRSLESLPLEAFTNLVFLRVKNCGKLHTLSAETPTHLTSVEIVNCAALEAFHLAQGNRLTKLKMKECVVLNNLPSGQVAHLIIDGCKGLTPLPLDRLPGLTHLTIKNFYSVLPPLFYKNPAA
ncbi:MAG: hypothetical protein ACPG7U_00010 [Holosporaceae bacterium]